MRGKCAKWRAWWAMRMRGGGSAWEWMNAVERDEEMEVTCASSVKGRCDVRWTGLLAWKRDERDDGGREARGQRDVRGGCMAGAKQGALCLRTAALERAKTRSLPSSCDPPLLSSLLRHCCLALFSSLPIPCTRHDKEASQASVRDPTMPARCLLMPPLCIPAATNAAKRPARHSHKRARDQAPRTAQRFCYF